MYKYTDGSRPDLYEAFSTGEGYKKVPGVPIPNIEAGQVRQEYKMLRYYRSLLNYAMVLNPLGLTLYLAILLFAVAGSFVFAYDCLRLLYSMTLKKLITKKPSKIVAKPATKK